MHDEGRFGSAWDDLRKKPPESWAWPFKIGTERAPLGAAAGGRPFAWRGEEKAWVT